jgi:glycosyltransferase involved in cell wall biosynthesis
MAQKDFGWNGGWFMRILMLAPQPFFEPRGAPLSVYHRVRAYGLLNHRVDLVTYPIGQDVALPGMTLHRVWRVPGLKRVKVGPSLAKLPLDIILFLRAFGLLMMRRYDAIHTNQEAGILGAVLGWLFRTPHIFDMHADMAEELVNFQFTQRRFLVQIMRALQQVMLRSSRVTIAAYPELVTTIAELAPATPVVLIENLAVAAEEAERATDATTLATVQRLRAEFGLSDSAGPVLVYTGTFEAYQGLAMLLQSVPAVLRSCPDARYLIVGGLPEQVARLTALAEHLGVAHAVQLPGRRPMEEMVAFMQLADVLLSPRSEGTNTPLKLYSYLHAGKPILATNIRSHTQVLTDTTAVLVAPTSEALAEGARRLLADAQMQRRLGTNARHLAATKYGYATFLAQTADVLRFIEAAPPTAIINEAAAE